MNPTKTATVNGHETLPPEAIRQIRELTGLTQEKFAAHIGVTFPTINRWKNGHAKPSPLALIVLKHVLDELGDRGAEILQKYFKTEGQALSAG